MLQNDINKLNGFNECLVSQFNLSLQSLFGGWTSVRFFNKLSFIFKNLQIYTRSASIREPKKGHKLKLDQRILFGVNMKLTENFMLYFIEKYLSSLVLSTTR